MRNGTLGFVIGLILGGVLAALSIMNSLPGMMLVSDESAFGFDSTVAVIEERATAAGWKLPKRYRLDQTLAQEGHQVLPVAVIELCKPEYAAAILQDDGSRAASALMPCRLAVYETAAGGVRVARMNGEAMSRLFSGVMKDAMGKAAADSETLLAGILREEQR